jgi:hypothetical protein
VSELYTTIAFDPGGTTGWSVVSVYLEAMRDKSYKILDNVVHRAMGQMTGPLTRQVSEMLDLVAEWESAKIVMESFILRKLTMDPNMLDPVRVIAAFEFGLVERRRKRDAQRSIIFQQPSLAMGTMTDDRLKAIGWLEGTVGMPHARDAERHALTWLRRAKEIMQVHE